MVGVLHQINVGLDGYILSGYMEMPSRRQKSHQIGTQINQDSDINMALKKSFQTEFGTTHADAYHRIGSIIINKDKSSDAYIMGFTVEIYIDEEKRNGDNYKHIATKFAECEIDPAVNCVKQGYNELKANHDYAEAEDV